MTAGEWHYLLDFNAPILSCAPSVDKLSNIAKLTLSLITVVAVEK